MAFDGHSTPAPQPPVTFTADAVDFETVVRVMMGRASVSRIKKQLEWFYSHGGVARPEDRDAPPSNVVSLSRHRAYREIGAQYGPEAVAALEQYRGRRGGLMAPFALRLEKELEIVERIAARKAERTKKRQRS